jgi:sec-independent protein translocase protein TatA
MFRSFGWPEIVLILVIVLIVFGAGKLPQIGRALGQTINEFKGSTKNGAAEKGVAKSEITDETKPVDKGV